MEACFFFFSSRRRHTRLTCDWSSDVCSSDLLTAVGAEPRGVLPGVLLGQEEVPQPLRAGLGLELGDQRQRRPHRSEEHTSELQSHVNLVCRLLLEKKKEKQRNIYKQRNARSK